MTIDDRPRFVEPMIAPAVYLLTPIQVRHEVHLALSAALPADSYPALRHRAIATIGPDDDLAAALERTARRDLGEGFLAWAADGAYWAALLSSSSIEATERYGLALRAATIAGDDAWAQELLALLAPNRTGRPSARS